jgi:hypothetical protein
MNKFSIKTALSVALVASLGMMGCLKDKSYDNRSIQSVRGDDKTNQKVVEIQLTATNTNNFLLTAFEATSNDTVFNLIPVVLASPGVATEDVHVTLVPNPTLVADYNAANGTNYTAAPSNIYTILNPNYVVTIPAGSRVGYLQIKFKPVDFLGHEYAFGYSIAGIDKPGYLISGNLNKGIAAIGIKNKYDGRYELRGFHNRPGLDLPYDEVVDMITTAQDKVYMYWVGQGPYHPLNGGTTAYGNFTVEFKFNTSTNAFIGVENLATPGSPIFTIGPSTTSRFDPATKTIYAQFYYNGNLQRVFTDTLFYLSARP